MRIVTGIALALATLFAATHAEAAITKRQAASRIKAALVKSDKVTDKAGKFSTRLGKLVKGTKYVYAFNASNVRRVILPFVGPGGAQGGNFVYTGGAAYGTINLRSEKVTVKGYNLIKGLPPRPALNR